MYVKIVAVKKTTSHPLWGKWQLGSFTGAVHLSNVLKLAQGVLKPEEEQKSKSSLDLDFWHLESKSHNSSGFLSFKDEISEKLKQEKLVGMK